LILVLSVIDMSESRIIDFIFSLEVFHEHFPVDVLEVTFDVFLVSLEGRDRLAGLDAFGAFPERGARARHFVLVRRNGTFLVVLIRRA
jgi:hypothetical protein